MVLYLPSFVFKKNYAAGVYSSIRKSRADSFREQLAEAHGDHRATWRVANRLLHNKPPMYYSDDECAHVFNI